jgi:DUF4097 and DUF4098 domain-containing protein YvlB
MKKLWYLTAIGLILIGLAGVISFGWKTNDDLSDFEKKWTYSAAELRMLHIVSDYNVNVSFVKSTDGSNSIQLKGHGSKEMIEKTKNTEISSQSLKLDLTQMPKKYINFFDFSSIGTKEDLVISVTNESLLDSLMIEIGSSNLTVTDAANVRITDAELSADSGNLTIDNFKSDRLNAKVDSGNINGNAITAELTASADSGNIKFESMTGRASLSVDSGNIKLYKLDNSNAELSADSGNIYVQVPASFAGFYDLQAGSGTVHSPESKRQTKDYVKARTDSGNIKVEQQ